MTMPTILFSIDPEESCLIVSTSIGEDELQRLRNKFPKHRIVSCCTNHAPPEGAVFASSLLLSRLPPCGIVLTPDDGWNIDSIKL